ncbi:DUF4188 domain-containing protein [Halobacteriales archaeon QS_8_69_26]|nr:MAG: DUF4188 domain-containing protein [Halobacteriales archaeon QS_8_69_26]
MSDDGRYTAELDEEFVVFLIGMRINALWRVHEWLPVFLAMPRMLREIRSRDRAGLLESRTTVSWRGVTVIQYWEGFESLRAYAQDPEGEHHPAWVEYNTQVADSGGVGIWHETYRVRPGDHETVYNNMPRQGLAAAGITRAADGNLTSAAGRLGRTDGQDAPITPSGETAKAGEAGEDP